MWNVCISCRDLVYFCQMIYENPFFIETTDSTNRQLASLLAQHPDLPDYFTVFTDFQTAGRGQGSHRWQSEKGKNVLASVLFKPLVSPNRQFVVNQCFALAVRQLLSHYVQEVKIKWPNDIYVQNQKIAGILIEHFIEGDKVKNTIAGVGINVNQTNFDEDIPNPISLKLLLNKDFDSAAILRELMASCRQFKCSENTNYQEVNNEYLHYLYLMEEYADYEIENKITEAKIVGIDEYGRLQLYDKKGQRYCCGMREVSLCLK